MSHAKNPIDNSGVNDLVRGFVMGETTPQPFFKSAGGKRQLLHELRARLPAQKPGAAYLEPFVGAGALFFDLAARGRLPSAVTIQDANPHLIAAYLAVRDDPDALLLNLAAHARHYAEDPVAHFAKVRAAHWSTGFVTDGARFLFLNKTCFNGLWRVNKKGEFNVPHGKFKSPPVICNTEAIMAAHWVLQGVSIECEDFAFQTQHAKRGDVVYFDPPYVPASASSNFTGYVQGGFSFDDQKRLRDLALALKAIGVFVMLSNADVPTVHELYARGFKIERVSVRRAINSKGAKRGAVGEVIIT